MLSTKVYNLILITVVKVSLNFIYTVTFETQYQNVVFVGLNLLNLDYTGKHGLL